MRFKLMLVGIIMSFALSGCGGTSAVIKQVQDLPVEKLSASENSKPIQFTKIIVKMKRGEHIGAWKAGWFCVPKGDLTWKGGRLNLDSDEFTEAFKEELEKYSFKTVGDTNALFEDPSTWKSEILVAGLVKELKANICYPNAGFGNYSSSKGEAFIKVDWQIYSKLDRSVVHSVTTEGASTIEESTDGGASALVMNSFAQATRNLLADLRFREIVSKGGDSVRDTSFKLGEKISIAKNTSAGLGSNAEEWQHAVVTVFAGRGHGSGFVIGDDMILTNHHVVGEASVVSIKFSSGMEMTGKVVAGNSGRDVAIVKVEAKLPKRFNIAKDSPSIGSEVYAIGTPVHEKFQATVSKGIISGIREDNNKKFIQSDVNIRPGSSGGPLVDKAGSVVGIAVSTLIVNNAQQGINFFIPIADALKILEVN